MRYYPLNRVKTNQRTNGDEFTLNGQPYKGYYYSTYDGKAFTGKDPVQGPSEQLRRVEFQILSPVRRSTVVAELEPVGVTTNSDLQQLSTFQEPKAYYPQPTETDYKRGSIIRYFAKKRDRVGYVIEIDKATFDSLQKADSVYDYVTYESISSFWQISGPLYDNRVNKQYKVAGIIDTNKRLIESKESTFPGLKAFIGDDYAKFAKTTPN